MTIFDLFFTEGTTTIKFPAHRKVLLSYLKFFHFQVWWTISNSDFFTSFDFWNSSNVPCFIFFIPKDLRIRNTRVIESWSLQTKSHFINIGKIKSKNVGFGPSGLNNRFDWQSTEVFLVRSKFLFWYHSKQYSLSPFLGEFLQFDISYPCFFSAEQNID